MTRPQDSPESPRTADYRRESRYAESARFEQTQTTAARPVGRGRGAETARLVNDHKVIAAGVARVLSADKVSKLPVSDSMTPGYGRPPHLHIEPGRLRDLRNLPPQFRRLALVQTGDSAAPARTPKRSAQVAERQDRRDRTLGVFRAVEIAASCASHDSRSQSTAKSGKHHRPASERMPGRDDQRLRRPGRQDADRIAWSPITATTGAAASELIRRAGLLTRPKRPGPLGRVRVELSSSHQDATLTFPLRTRLFATPDTGIRVTLAS